MATYTSTVFSAQPKQVEKGVNVVQGQIMMPSATSVGDVAFLCKVPHGAQIIDFIEDHSITGSTALAVKFGLATGAVSGGGASYSCFIAAGAVATVNRRSIAGFPAIVSVSDNSAARYGILSGKVASGSMSVSLVINFTLTYRCDL